MVTFTKGFLNNSVYNSISTFKMVGVAVVFQNFKILGILLCSYNVTHKVQSEVTL